MPSGYLFLSQNANLMSALRRICVRKLNIKRACLRHCAPLPRVEETQEKEGQQADGNRSRFEGAFPRRSKSDVWKEHEVLLAALKKAGPTLVDVIVSMEQDTLSALDTAL